MKTWQNAEIVELNITETASGQVNTTYECVAPDGWGTNDSLLTNGDNSQTPDTLS
ncbi:MAG: hypothetical protein J6B39_09040 [Lachnospiraceae bacterium]|nr:hypothetical protein [Lachnospiraceae bacterium]